MHVKYKRNKSTTWKALSLYLLYFSVDFLLYIFTIFLLSNFIFLFFFLIGFSYVTIKLRIGFWRWDTVMCERVV